MLSRVSGCSSNSRQNHDTVSNYSGSHWKKTSTLVESGRIGKVDSSTASVNIETRLGPPCVAAWMVVGVVVLVVLTIVAVETAEATSIEASGRMTERPGGTRTALLYPSCLFPFSKLVCQKEDKCQGGEDTEDGERKAGGGRGATRGACVSVGANKRPGSMDTSKGKREKKTKIKTMSMRNRDKGLGVCGNI
ncbi:hypothetical protein B0T10DRAFT_112493 [Thelonectria olida]|uniref:Uncharacterized protein n=1 Tax=Thelonectria olida TaxID=1576542 RepID=A0A9P9AVS6_9HYPO|nr:hypothetical protein B0T10DRAFT_112493 [Thelonectria olida]